MTKYCKIQNSKFENGETAMPIRLAGDLNVGPQWERWGGKEGGGDLQAMVEVVS